MIGCAQPTCIGSLGEGDEDSLFNTIQDGVQDGFLREGDRQRISSSVPNKPFAVSILSFFQSISCTHKKDTNGMTSCRLLSSHIHYSISWIG